MVFNNVGTSLPSRDVDEWVFQRGDAVDSDVLFVFGTPHHVTDFAVHIHRLWGSLGLRRVIVSGHRGEAESLAVAAHRLGTPGQVFLLERNASNTRDNVSFSVDLLRAACPHGQLHVLAKLYAAPRSLLTLRRWFPQWRLAVHVVDWFGVSPANWRGHRPFSRKVAKELRKVADYVERGDIAPATEPWTCDALRETASALCDEREAIEASTVAPASSPPPLQVSVTETVRQEVGDMQLVMLEAQLHDAAGRSALRTTVVERPDAVGVIAYDDVLDEVILVEQFRAGPYVAAGTPLMLEVVAGYIDEGEGAQEAARRELHEETGLWTERLVHIATYFAAPTLSTEQMSLWCGLVDARAALQRCANGAERIHIVRVPGAQAVAMLLENRISNALTLTALQWLLQARPVLLAARRGEAT